MSISVMANYPIAMSKGLKKSPTANSIVQKTVANKGVASASLQPYPTWVFEFDMDRITGNEALASSVIASFIGIHIACNGRAFPFLFIDPQDNAVTQINSGMLNVTPGAAQPMGQFGDGASKQFQLARIYGSAGVPNDIIQNVAGSISVYVNGSFTTAYSVDGLGVVTFNSAPANGATLTWSGNFYFYVRFESDNLDCTRVYTENSGTDQWDVSSIRFSSEFI
jgi:uncharacterized protein (TIGR02217 family)